MGVVIPEGYGSAAVVMSSLLGTPPYVTTIGVDLFGWGTDYYGAAEHVFDTFCDNFEDHLAYQLSVDYVSLTVNVDGVIGSVQTSGLARVGQRESESETLAMATVFYKQSEVLGRSGRGRSYIPGLLAENDVGWGGAIEVERREELLEAYQGWMGDMNSTEGPTFQLIPVLLHSEAVGMEPSPLAGYGIREKVGWVRGRLH